MIRMSNTAYASNSSIGSTNNLLGTPGGGLFQNRNLSPNQFTKDYLSNNSNNKPPGDQNMFMRNPNNQIMMDANGNYVLSVNQQAASTT